MAALVRSTSVALAAHALAACLDSKAPPVFRTLLPTGTPAVENA
ncbi:hypothetical protein [Phenylobacterium montanum]|nr:hypothetical protein [Caulobacter sp. S6]